MTQNGKVEVPHAGGTFLNDGDVVHFTASAKGSSGSRIGFGDVITEIVPAL